MIRKLLALSMSLTLILSGCGQGTVSNPPGNGNANTHRRPCVITPTTASAAIKHVVVIFGENISFDHYFGTYPNALNLARRDQVHRRCRHADPEQLHLEPRLLTESEPEPRTRTTATGVDQIPSASRPAQALHRRPEPRLHRRAASLRQRQDGSLSRSPSAPPTAPPLATATGARHRRHQGPHHGLLRRQHRHRALELRPALRHERPLLQHHLRPLDPGRPQPHLRPDQRRHQ